MQLEFGYSYRDPPSQDAWTLTDVYQQEIALRTCRILTITSKQLTSTIAGASNLVLCCLLWVFKGRIFGTEPKKELHWSPGLVSCSNSRHTARPTQKRLSGRTKMSEP